MPIATMKKLQQVLISQGFNQKEAQVYLSLLSLQEATPSEISRLSKVKRPTCYLILEELVRNGYAVRTPKGKTLHYRALNPNILLERQYERYLNLKDSLPSLHDLVGTGSSTPHMSVFEGPAGLKEMMEQTLEAKSEILYWADMTLITTTVFKNYWRTYIKKRVERGIRVRGILSFDKLALEFKRRSKEDLREVHLIPKDAFPFQNEINIYDDKVTMISHEDLLGIIIQNKRIAETQRSIFNFAFEYAKIVEKKLLEKGG